MIDTKELRTVIQEIGLNGVCPAEITELLDRLESAEKERDNANAAAVGIALEAERLQCEIDNLRAKIEAMEQQKPIAWARKLGLDVPSFGCVTDLKYRPSNIPESSYIPLYLAPGAQPAPIEQDTSVRKAWARFSNELHRSPDAPYPGMSETFERHFSQSFTDREWRSESATWAAAWKAAKRHEAQAQPAPSVSDSWPIHADPFAYVIQHLNSNPYPLTKDETITFIKELRALYNAATEAKP